MSDAPPIDRIEEIRKAVELMHEVTQPNLERIQSDMRFLLEQIDVLHAFVHARSSPNAAEQKLIGALLEASEAFRSMAKAPGQ